MSTENIDVVINPGTGARQVVRDINDIAAASKSAGTALQQLQQSVNTLGSNSGLSRFQSQLNAVNTQLQQMNQQMAQMGNGLNRVGSNTSSGLGTIAAAIKGVLGVMSVKTVMDWADAWVSAEGKIKSLAPSLQDAQLVMSKLFDIAQNTRQPIDKLAQLYHFMSISAKDLGASQEDMLKVTETVSKSLAVQGTTMAQARGAILQLSQAFGTGRVRAQEFNSMMQGTPLLLSLVAKNIEGAGGSVAKLRQIMLEGKLSSADFFQALLKASNQADELFKSAPKTFGQGFIVLKNAIEQYVGTLSQASGTSQAFFGVMEALSKNVDNTARSLALIGVVLLALPFGPVAVAVAASAAAMELFGSKILVGVDNVTTLKDVAGVAFDDMVTRMTAVQVKIAEFGAKYIPDLQNSFSGLSNVTLLDMARATATAFDSMIQAASGAVEGIKASFMSLPTVLDEIGKLMFNALVTRIQDGLNAIIEGINKISQFTGQSVIDTINLEKAKVDEKAFQKVGQDISNAVAEGMKAAGSPIAKNLEDVMARAGTNAAVRFHDAFRKSEMQSQNNLSVRSPASGSAIRDPGAAARAARDELAQLTNLFQAYKQNADQLTELERHKEVMLKASYDSGVMNFREYTQALEGMQDAQYEKQKKLIEETLPRLAAQQADVQKALAGKRGATSQEQANEAEDYRRKIEELVTTLEKLRGKQEELIAQRTAAKLKPFIDFDTNTERQLAVMAQALQGEREKIALQQNINALTERELFVRDNIIQLLAPYKQKLAEVQAKMQEMRDTGLFDPDNPQTVAAMARLQARSEEIQGIIKQIPIEFGQALAIAFDAGKIAEFSRNLREGIADAITVGIFEGGKKGGQQLRKFLEEELLRKPFKMIIEALIKPITDLLASGVSSVVNGIIGQGASSIAGMLGGGGSTIGTIGSALGIGGGGAAAAGGAFESGFVGTSAVSGAAGVGGATLGAFGTLGVYGLIAYGVYKIFDSIFSSKGGPKQGGYAGAVSPSGGNAIGVQDTQNQQLVQQLTQTINELNANFNRMAALTGRPTAQFGIGASTDPSGSSASFLEVNARDANGNIIFSKASTDIGRDAQAMTDAIAQFTQEATAGAMAANGITQAMVDQAMAAGQASAATTAQSGALIDSATAAAQAAAAAAAQGASAEQQAAAAAAAAQQATVNAGLVNELTQTFMGMGIAASNLSVMSDQAKLSLINVAGGLQNLQAGLAAYYQNFFTEEEQRQALIQQVNMTLASAGVALNAAVATREQFRALAQSLDLNTAAGQAMFAAMMNVAGAFAQITDNSKQLAAEAQARAQAEAAAAAEAARAEQQRQHEELMAAQERARQEAEAARAQAAWEAEQARQKAEREAEIARQQAEAERIHAQNISDLQQAYQKERSDIESVINATEQWGNSLKSFKAGLLTGTNSPFTPVQRYANARTEYDKTLNDLSSTDMNTRTAAQGNFQQVAQTFLEASRTVNASSTQYQMDYAQVMSDTDRAITINEAQHTVAQQQLVALNASVSNLIDINGGVKSVAEALAALAAENSSGNAFAPWDPTRHYMPGDQASYGGSNYVSTALTATQWNENSRPDYNSTNLATNYWDQVGAITPYANDPYSFTKHYMPGERAMSNGTLYQATELSRTVWNENSTPELNPALWTALPGHASGLNFVPHNDYVFRAHYGEAVLNRQEADAHRAGQGIDLTPLLQAMSLLRQEIAELREQHAQGVKADLAAQEQAAKDVADRIVQGVGTSQERVAYKTQQRTKAAVM